MQQFLAIVNPAAGGGRSAKLAGPALARLRAGGIDVDVVSTSAPCDAVRLAREGYAQGYRKFLAVGGDGTGHEILNGIFSAGAPTERVAMGFLPLGTGNSFLARLHPRWRQSFSAGAPRTPHPLHRPHAPHARSRRNVIPSISSAWDSPPMSARSPIAISSPSATSDICWEFLFASPSCVRSRLPCVATKTRSGTAAPACFSLSTTAPTPAARCGLLLTPSASDGLIEFVHWGPIGRLAAAAHVADDLRWPAHAASAGFAPRRPPRGIQHARAGGRHGRRRSAASAMPRRWISCPRRWTSTYEPRLAGGARRDFVGCKPGAFFYCRADSGISGNFSRSAQNRLAAAQFLPAHRVFVRRSRRSAALARVSIPRAPVFSWSITSTCLIPSCCTPPSRNTFAAGNWNRTSRFPRTAG